MSKVIEHIGNVEKAIKENKTAEVKTSTQLIKQASSIDCTYIIIEYCSMHVNGLHSTKECRNIKKEAEENKR